MEKSMDNLKELLEMLEEISEMSDEECTKYDE